MKKKDLLKEAKTEIDKVETLLINVKKRKIKANSHDFKILKDRFNSFLDTTSNEYQKLYESNFVHIDIDSQNPPKFNSTAIADNLQKEDEHYEIINDSNLDKYLMEYEINKAKLYHNEILASSSSSSSSSSSASNSGKIEKSLSIEKHEQEINIKNPFKTHTTKLESSTHSLFQNYTANSNFIDMSQDSLNIEFLENKKTPVKKSPFSPSQLSQTDKPAYTYMTTTSTPDKTQVANLEYRQTFAGTSATSGKYHSRSFLPPPPPLAMCAVQETPNQMQSHFAQIINSNQPFRLNSCSSISNNSISTNKFYKQKLQQDTEEKRTENLETQNANISIRNEFNLLNNSVWSLSSLFNKNISNNNSSNCLNEMFANNPDYSEFNDNTNLFPDSMMFESPYAIKYKKPPSYEESLRKLKKNSLNSSSFSSSMSTTNEYAVNSAEESKSSSIFTNYDGNQIQNSCANKVHSEPLVITNDDSTNAFISEDKDRTSQFSEFLRGDGEVTEANDDNTIALSIENLEEIREKAASMSLPLLAALCSDKSLIQSLNNKNKQYIK